MIDRLSIVMRGGVEIYSYTSPNKEKKINSQLFSGLFYAIQSVSEEIEDPVSSIRLQNSIIYVKSYSDYSIFLIFSNTINDVIIENAFKELAKITLYFFDQLQKFVHPFEFINQIEKIVTYLNNAESSTINKFNPDYSMLKKRIAIAGLGNAGKTSIKKKFFDNWDLNRIKNLTPTIGLETSKNIVNFINESFLALDFGGQSNYRFNYLSDKKNWSNLSCLIFVIDIQKPEYYSEAKSYLDEIYDVIKNINVNQPFTSIFLHKYDSDKKEIINSYLEQFFYVFKEYSYKVTFFFTSIFDESTFSAMLKTIYFSLPTIMIKQIFERILMDKFENEILFNKNIKNMLELSDMQLFEIGNSVGKKISDEFQNQWLNSYFGNLNPTPRGILAKQVHYKVESQNIQIEIENWTNKGIVPKITDPLLTGVLKGVLNTLFLTNEIRVVQKKNKTIWIIDI